MNHGLMVAGTHSRCGKTTATLALMAALGRAGRRVAPFKAGPDFIDPGWHRTITGTPSHNLDTVMVGEGESRRLLARHGAGAVAVVEGVMGLYDGREGIGGPGSTAHLARTLGLPVLLVVDGQGMAGSIAPLVEGFARYAEGFRLLGVLATRVGSPSHARLLGEALASRSLPPLVGWLERDPTLSVPERHLGLTLPGETPPLDPERLAAALHLEVESLLAAALLPDHPPPPSPPGREPLLAGRVVAVARDAAFCFLYPANLEWLAEMGARVHFFSPLAGEPLPPGSQALWLPGGYPELHGEALARSASWESVTAFAAAGGPVLAECGGMMALGRELVEREGRAWPMAGVLPTVTRMTGRVCGLGYREERGGARGHEFHHSRRDPCPLPPAFVVAKGDGGVALGGVRASYLHWYFPSAPGECARWLGGEGWQAPGLSHPPPFPGSGA